MARRAHAGGGRHPAGGETPSGGARAGVWRPGGFWARGDHERVLAVLAYYGRGVIRGAPDGQRHGAQGGVEEAWGGFLGSHGVDAVEQVRLTRLMGEGNSGLRATGDQGRMNLLAQRWT